MAEAVRSTRSRPRSRPPEVSPCERAAGGRGDRGRLHLRRRADPLGRRLRPRLDLRTSRPAPRHRHRQHPHRARPDRRRGGQQDWRSPPGAPDRRRVGGGDPRPARRRGSTRSTGSRSARRCRGAARVARDAAGYYADVPAVVVEPGVRTGVPVLIDNPREVGTDRIVNALAAATTIGGPCIVVDFGTAHDVRRGQRRGGTSAGRSARHRDLGGRARPTGARSCVRSSCAAAVGDRPRTRWRRCSPAWSSASPARSTGSWPG